MIIEKIRNLRCIYMLCQSSYRPSMVEAIKVRTTMDDGLPVHGYPFLLPRG